MTHESMDALQPREANPIGPTPEPEAGGGPKRPWWPWLLGLCLLGAGGYWLYPLALGPDPAKSGKSASEKAPSRATPVVTATATKGTLSIYLTGLGSVMALNTVTIRSRVDGQLDKVAFVEGQLVKQGDLLAEIDPRPFQAQLAQMEGQLARDEALLKNARIDLERDQIAKDAISAQQLATQAALVSQYEGIVKSDQGQVDQVKLQLIYSRITAPITGRIGLRQIDAGNMVHANDLLGLAVVTQLQPISVVFSLAADSLPQVLARMKAGPTLVVEAYNRDLNARIATGSLLAVDNQIDPTTGTVRLKALFPNEDQSLFPNQFVNARLLVDERKGATLIPVAAVQRGPQQTSYVFVVQDKPSKADPSKMEKRVAKRDIVVGPSEGDVTVVESGLAPDEIVVTDGVDKLQENSKVEVPQAAKPGANGGKP
jgi:multidrug efflux system membrane fusion protein